MANHRPLVAPARRRAVPAKRRRRGRALVLSGAVLLATALMLVAAWEVAWRSLEGLPATETFERAQALSDTPAAPRPTLTRVVAEPERDVRYVERAGIVGPRLEGNLQREEPVELAGPPLPPPPTGPELELHRLVVIESAGVINVRTHKLRLAHVAAPDGDRVCRREDGTSWPCGKRARTALRRLVQRRALGCLEIDTEVAAADQAVTRVEGLRPAECQVAGIDLSRWLVENGWAIPDKGAPKSWDELHANAKQAGLGLFSPRPR